MINRRLYSDKEIKELLDTVTVLIDTREKCPDKHITNYFDNNNIPYKKMALKAGDYSFYLPQNEELGIQNDMYFFNDIVIERKASLDELAGNFTQNRERFNDEFSRMAAAKRYLIIENASYRDIATHHYRSQYNEKAFMASLFSFQIKYDLSVQMFPAEFTGYFIYELCRYCCRYFLKQG